LGEVDAWLGKTRRWGTVVSCCSLAALLLLSCCSLLRAAEAENELESSLDVFYLDVVGQQDFEFANFKLKRVSPGTTKNASVILQNLSENPLELIQVSASCKCTTAKVPRITIQPGESERLDFSFEVSKKTTSLLEVFDATIVSGGARKKISMRFNAQLENVVSFGRNDFIHAFNGKSAVESFTIPILVSDIDLLKGVSAKATGELGFVETKVVVEDRRAYVRVRFAPTRIADDMIAGDLQIERDGKVIADILCMFERRKNYQLLPDMLVFVVEDDGLGNRVASGIFKLASADPSQPISVREILCQTSKEGMSLTTSYKKIGTELYRLKTLLNLDAKVESKGKLDWQFKTSAGQTISIQSDYVFSN
jgi:hypothetical protein